MSTLAEAKKKFLDYLKITTIAVFVMTVICAVINSIGYLLNSKVTVFLTILFWLLAIVAVAFSPGLSRKDSQEN